jgi:hypothetical protein
MDELATAVTQALQGICIGVVGAVLLMAGMAAMGIRL